MRAAGLDVPTYLEGRPLQPYWEGKGDDFAPREWVFYEDNYQIMMRESATSWSTTSAKKPASYTIYRTIRTSSIICGTGPNAADCAPS